MLYPKFFDTEQFESANFKRDTRRLILNWQTNGGKRKMTFLWNAQKVGEYSNSMFSCCDPNFWRFCIHLLISTHLFLSLTEMAHTINVKVKLKMIPFSSEEKETKRNEKPRKQKHLLCMIQNNHYMIKQPYHNPFPICFLFTCLL